MVYTDQRPVIGRSTPEGIEASRNTVQLVSERCQGTQVDHREDVVCIRLSEVNVVNSSYCDWQ